LLSALKVGEALLGSDLLSHGTISELRNTDVFLVDLAQIYYVNHQPQTPMAPMRVPLGKQITICIFNLLFPPLSVGLLTGFTSRDTLINCLLFLLAVFPAHIHGFMISMTYFHRKRKVRKGKFPGKAPSYTKSEKVVTGGAGWEAYEVLRGGRGKRSWRTFGRRRTEGKDV
jgi:uncharacterized membrane protein YqaE (UPF0057 family)